MTHAMRRACGLLPVLVLALTVAPAPAQAQGLDPWTAIKQLQTDLRSGRQTVVAANLPLTEGEAKAFWPVYQQYRADMDKLGDRTAALIAAYAANYESMDDTKAEAFFKEWMGIERDKTAARDRHVPKIRAVLPAQKAARLFQIDNKIDAVINLELADTIPLVPVKK